MNTLGAEAARVAGLEVTELERVVGIALAEDLRYGPDLTSEATIPATRTTRAAVVARQRGVLCGNVVALAVLDAVGFPLDGTSAVLRDGAPIGPGDAVLALDGPARPLLLAERTMLNLMTHLSGIATATNRWVRELAGTTCEVRDTRKTTPGLRQLEKYAVRCGGGTNHRLGLGDAALLKDNHIAAAGGIARAVAAIRREHPEVVLEVECDTLDQVREALDAGCSLILLDNMDLEAIAAAVEVIRHVPGVLVEASGSMTLERARSVAQTGVDYIAVGSLTHSVTALDLGLDVVP
ncbi:MAG: carboxylating nicotinate-nucleotide diphosphorylase [Acidimicrobiales bacterium]